MPYPFFVWFGLFVCFAWCCFGWLLLLFRALLAPLSWSSPPLALACSGRSRPFMLPLGLSPFFVGAQHSGLFASGISTSSALLAVSTFLSPVCLFFLLRCLSSWVWCLVFLAVDWSRISSIILFIFPCLLVCLAQHLPSRFITIKYHFPRKGSSVIFLAVDWSGVSPPWPPQSISTVSGRRLDQGLCHLAIVWIS